MSTAAATVEATRTPLVDELVEVVGAYACLPHSAQHAVAEFARSLCEDPEATSFERDLAATVLVLAAETHRV